MNQIRCYITRRYNGLMLITKFEPTIVEVMGTDHEDAYIKYGDPVGYLNISNEFASTIFPSLPKKYVEPRRAKMYGSSNIAFTHYVTCYNNLYTIHRIIAVGFILCEKDKGRTEE